MTTQTRRISPIDLRSLPIAVKTVGTLLIVLLVSGLVVASLLRRTIFNSQTDVVMNDLAALSQAEAVRLNDRLEREIETLSHLGGSSTIQAVLRRWDYSEDAVQLEDAMVLAERELVAQQVELFLQTNDEFSSVALFDVQGNLVASVPESEEGAPALTEDWEWVEGALESPQGLNLRNPQNDGGAEQQGVHIAVPVMDAASTMPSSETALGVLYGVWNMNNVLDVVEFGNQQDVLILAPDGSVLAAHAYETGTELPTDLYNRFGPGPGSFIYTGQSGEEWLFGYTRLADLDMAEAGDELGWIAVARQPATVIQTGAGALLSRILLVLTASLGVSLLVLLMVTIRLLHPLRRLTLAARQIEGGDLRTPIPDSPGDEIGQLSGVLRSLVTQLTTRLNQLHTAVEVSHAATLTRDVWQMLADIAQALIEQLGYTEAHIYLADRSGQYAWLQAMAGAAGAGGLQKGQRVPIDEETLVGRAMLLGSLEQETPPGQVKVALPLRVGARILGAIYVTTRREGRLSEEDLDILSLIGDQLGAALENTRLLEETAANVHEIEALNRRLTREAWQERLGAGQTLRHTLDPDGRWPDVIDEVRQLADTRAETYVDADGRSVLAVPLKLRGETVGTLAVTRPPSEGWARDEALLLESIAARMTMIADGIRLVEEASLQAEREQTLNQVSATLLQRAASVDNILQTALGQLSGALGSDHVSLRIGPPPEGKERHSPPGNHDGQPPAPDQQPGQQAEDNGQPGGEGGLNNGQ
jgi:GAF domain-containing protein